MFSPEAIATTTLGTQSVKILQQQAEFVWHESASLGNLDAVILPGGFSYGDYLRCGAIAKFSPVMAAVKRLPPKVAWFWAYAMVSRFSPKRGSTGRFGRNANLKFVCRPVELEVVTTNSPFTHEAKKGQRLTIPIAHGEGCYVAQERVLDELQDKDRIVLSMSIIRTVRCATLPAF